MRFAVGLDEPLVVIVNGSGHARPGLGYTQSSRRVAGTLHISLRKKKQNHCNKQTTQLILRAKIWSHHSNCLHNLWGCSSHKVAWRIFNTHSDTHTHTTRPWPLLRNPDLPFPVGWFTPHPQRQTSPHLSVHEDRLDAKEGSHGHSWDDLCVGLRWPRADADPTCLWEHSAQRSRVKRCCARILHMSLKKVKQKECEPFFFLFHRLPWICLRCY